MNSVSHCPDCNHKLVTWDSRPHSKYGFQTIRRKRKCAKCKFRSVTVEVPEELGDSIFEEDEE